MVMMVVMVMMDADTVSVEREWVEPGVDERAGVSGAWRYSVMSDSSNGSARVIGECWSVRELIIMLWDELRCNDDAVKRVVWDGLGLRVNNADGVDIPWYADNYEHVGVVHDNGAVLMRADKNDSSVAPVFGLEYGLGLTTGEQRSIIVTGFDYDWVMIEYCAFLDCYARSAVKRWGRVTWHSSLIESCDASLLLTLLTLASMREWCLTSERNAALTGHGSQSTIGRGGEPHPRVPFPVYLGEVCERCPGYAAYAASHTPSTRVNADNASTAVDTVNGGWADSPLWTGAARVGYGEPVLAWWLEDGMSNWASGKNTDYNTWFWCVPSASDYVCAEYGIDPLVDPFPIDDLDDDDYWA